jgi:ATP-binding protein involved in chromosome partitioning
MLPEEIPSMQHTQSQERIIPAESHFIKLISMAYFLHPEDPATVRAPIANGIIKQFVHLVDWGELDFFFIDFPPGTGDIQLTLIQEASISGAVIITTPQEVALLDVARSVSMFRQMQVPLIGVVENMSYYQTGKGEVVYPFGQGGGERFAQENELFFLGKIPIDPAISRCCDEGKSLFKEKSSATVAIASIGEKVQEQLEAFTKLKSHLFIHKIHQKKNHEFTIEWSDGKMSHHCLSDLQRRCPCIRCRDEKTGKQLIDKDVGAARIVRVGSYALQIFFTKGCSKGIYPFWMLR